MKLAIFEKFILVIGGFASKYGAGRLAVAGMLVVLASVGLVYGGRMVCEGLARLARDRSDRAVAAMSLLRSLAGLGAVLAIFFTGVHILGLPATAHLTREAPEGGAEARAAALAVLRSEEDWAALSGEEKLEVLEALKEDQRLALGISERIALREEEWLGDRVLGRYEDAAGRVSVQREHLETAPAREVVNTICHEMYHCYQHRLVELYKTAQPKNRDLQLFDRAKIYLKESGDYKRAAEDGYDAYARQMVENDARYYAQMTAERYCAQAGA